MQVLTWSAYALDRFAANRLARTQTATLDVASGTVSQATVSNTNHDMFCPGISMTGDGSVVVTGGDTSEKTSVYVQGQGWVPGPNMNIPRGYQSSTTLSNGQVRCAIQSSEFATWRCPTVVHCAGLYLTLLVAARSRT